MTRYIFITGGVVSSLGKGLTTAALGALLQARGFKVRLRKLDPYLNIDPGTMNPFQHGEVFVTEDGAETDLDLGHYERFTGVPSNKHDNTTTGQLYTAIAARERKGDYLGATVQVIPHVTDAIRAFITYGTEDVDFVLCEIGGTIGDIEGLPFFEAIRQMRHALGPERTSFLHLTLIPHLASVGEIKTKPTQHSVKEMRSLGIQPDIIACRCDQTIPSEERRKIALFCSVSEDAVIEARNAETIYEVPLLYHRSGLDREVLKSLQIQDAPSPDLSQWEDIVDRIKNPEGDVRIAIVGKYVSLPDAYKSLEEALVHGGVANRVNVNLQWLEAETLEADSDPYDLEGAHGILVPGGFGERGTEGMIRAAHFARTRRIPFLGICFGMQMSVIEAARNLLNLPAGSTEFGEVQEPLIGLMTEWMKEGEVAKRNSESPLGGTMRLGSYEAALKKGSLAEKIYGASRIHERHRHRYEVNRNYVQRLEEQGVVMSGMSPDGLLPEIMEISDHPWYIGVQYHPELASRPFAPHPLFQSFVTAALEQSRLV